MLQRGAVEHRVNAVDSPGEAVPVAHVTDQEPDVGMVLETLPLVELLGLVTTEDPDDLWSAVLRRKGGAFAVLAQMPPDPSSN